MSSLDFRTFVDTLTPGHQAWLATNPSPSGVEWLDHHVGDAAHPDGLLRRYEAWRVEHGYTRVRPWNGTEALSRPATADIPSPGRVFPWLPAASAGPAFADSFLAEGTTSGDMQAHFPSSNGLGAALRTHWNAVRSFNSGGEIGDDDSAPYSIRFWGFVKWASVLWNRFQGIPVFAIPIVYDANGVPLSDIEYMDTANAWHRVWHGGGACPANTIGLDSPMGQFCGRINAPGEFLKFHRNILDTYDNWRRRAGMPKAQRWKPAGVHFDHGGPDVSDDPVVQETEIGDYGKRFNTLEGMAQHQEGELHGSGHSSTASPEIADLDTNNYSPRFFAWHRWMDYLWEKRQPRFNSLRPVASDGTGYAGVLTVVRPSGPPDQIQPNNSLTGTTADGRGSLWIRYNVRPETYGRPINLAITAQVLRNSSDTTPVAVLAATPINVNPVAQGADSAAIEIVFPGLDAGEGAFARQNLPGGGVGFKNGRIRISGRLVPVGNVPGSTATDAANDEFDHIQHIDVVLVQESHAPVVSTLLNKSAFSFDEVIVNANGAAQSAFANSFFVVLQDPPEPAPGFGASSILPQNADPAHTAVSGIFADGSVVPSWQVVDESGNAVSWFTVILTDQFEEQPSLNDNTTQRVLFRYLALVDVAAVSALFPTAGAVPRFANLRITARDRSGNTIANVLSAPIKLFRDANPYMLDVRDENPHWLSIDTRVFSVRQTETKFAHSVSGSGSPNQYIADVLNEFNSGTQNFEAIPADQNQAALELAPVVTGVNVHNFTLARVRMKTQVAVPDVRVFFRLFTTALSNLSFTPTNYPTSPGVAPIALLGRTTPDAEIVSIPFFAAPRVETRNTVAGNAPMTTQGDPPNVQAFAITPLGGETVRYFGAYLDINSDTPRYPQAPSGDGAFPGGQCVSIRNVLRGQHQCMVAEIFFAGDLTGANETPGTSDNLAQRNLLIVETDNPGLEATHTVQHSFDFVMPSRRDRVQIDENVRREEVGKASRPTRAQAGPNRDFPRVAAATRLAMFHTGIAAALARPLASVTAAVATPGLAAWKHPGFDELLFFWNNLPPDSRVEIYLPGLDVGYIALVRMLRHAPDTVQIIDDHTLVLKAEGATYLPVPDLGLERLAGLLTVRLPDTIKTGQLFKVDVLQMRAATGVIVGAFQLMIPVSKAARIYAREARILDVFEERLRLTPAANRWHPILARQVDYFRARAKGLAEEAADECGHVPPGGGDGVRLRVIIEKIKILDAFGPLVHGSGEVRLTARVTSADAGGPGAVTALPPTGAYPVPDRPEGHVIELDKEVFRGVATDKLCIEILSADEKGKEHACFYRRTFKGKPDTWIGTYQPSDQQHDPENVGDWQLWYRIEKI